MCNIFFIIADEHIDFDAFMNMLDEDFSDIIKPKGPRYRYIHRILAIGSVQIIYH